jgi:hypothetical protein
MAGESCNNSDDQPIVLSLAEEFQECRIQASKRFATNRYQRFTCYCQSQAARQPVKQFLPQSMFQQADLLADRGGCDMEFFCGC